MTVEVFDSKPGTSQIIPAGATLDFHRNDTDNKHDRLTYVVIKDIDHDATQQAAGVMATPEGNMSVEEVRIWVSFLVNAGYIKDTRILN